MVTRLFYSIVIIILASVSVNAENQELLPARKISAETNTDTAVGTFDASFFTSKGFTPSYQTASTYSQFAQSAFFYFGRNNSDHNSNTAQSGVFFIVPSDSAQKLQSLIISAMEFFRDSNTDITVVISAGDKSTLPLFYQKNVPAGLKSCADMIESSGSCVFLITADTKQDIVIDAGADMAPYTMLQPLTDGFASADFHCSFSAALSECYYLRWVPQNPYLETFSQKNIPTASVAFGDNITAITEKAEQAGRALAAAISKTAQNTGTETDRHFLFLTDGTSFYYITEPVLIRIVTYACLAALFILCMSALVKKRKILQARTAALLQIWWIVPLYFAITSIALVMGKIIVMRLSISLAGNQDIWSYAPYTGITLQFLFTIVLLSFIQVIEQLSYFPDRQDVYGYLGNISAFISLIVFMSIQFSLAPLFVWMFICSYVVYHIKTRTSSVLLLILMYLPPIFVLYAGINAQARIFSATISVTNIGRYALITCMLMPLELNIARIKAMSGRIGKTERFRVPIITIVLTVVTMVFCLFTWVTPIFTDKKPQQVHISHLINDTGSNITVVSPYTLPTMEIVSGKEVHTISADQDSLLFNEKESIDAQYFYTEHTRTNILERSIVTISITSLKNENQALRYEIIVTDTNGTAVYDASLPYSLSESGAQCTFLPGEHPPKTFAFEFSTSKTNALFVRVNGLFAVPAEHTTVKASVPVTYTEIIDSMQTFTIEPEKE